MKKNSNTERGNKAEYLARDHFEKLGFELAETNYRYRRSEIDLIVLNETLLVFVEVKYRSNQQFGNPEEFVTDNQKKLIIEAADEYIHSINWQKNIRFDIVAIDKNDQIEHFEDAFY